MPRRISETESIASIAFRDAYFNTASPVVKTSQWGADFARWWETVPSRLRDRHDRSEREVPEPVRAEVLLLADAAGSDAAKALEMGLDWLKEDDRPIDIEAVDRFFAQPDLDPEEFLKAGDGGSYRITVEVGPNAPLTEVAQVIADLAKVAEVAEAWVLHESRQAGTEEEPGGTLTIAPPEVGTGGADRVVAMEISYRNG